MSKDARDEILKRHPHLHGAITAIENQGKRVPTKGELLRKREAMMEPLVNDTTAREVTLKIKQAERDLEDARAYLAFVTALRDDLRATKAKTIGDLPEDVRQKHATAIRLLSGPWPILQPERAFEAGVS
jgi:hypothetical protein